MLTFGVILRLVISTGVVVGGLLAVKWWSTRASSRGRGAIRVIARAGIARSSAVAVIEVGRHRYLVGAGEHSVNLLAELDPDEDLGGTPAVADQPDPGVDTVPSFGGAASFQQQNLSGVEGLAPRAITRDRPRTGLLGYLRRVTTRVPREVRIHGYDG